MKEKYPMSRKDNIVVQEANGETLIYDLKDNKAFCLNETSALIWELCDGNRSLTEISRELGKKLNSPANEGLVWLGLEQLKKEKLIENEVIAPAGFQGISRREAVRKVGLASLIAIPVLMSLNAPVAAASASVCAANFMDACRCPNGTGTNCPGNPSGVGPSNCSSTSAACLCRGPFGANNSAGAGFKSGTCS